MPFKKVAKVVKDKVIPGKQPEGVKNKAEWTKFRQRTTTYLEKHHNEVSKWANAAFDSINTPGLSGVGKNVESLKMAYLTDMTSAITNLVSGTSKMKAFESRLKTRTVHLRHKIEAYKARMDFNAIRESITDYDFLDKNVGKKMFARYAEMYVRVPRSKRISIAQLKKRMEETKKIFLQHKTILHKADEDIHKFDFRSSYGKLFSKGEKAKVFTMLGHYCNGNIAAGEKIFKEFKKQAEFQKKFSKVQKAVEGQGKRLGLHHVERMMSAYEAMGIPRAKVVPFMLKKIAYLKKLDPKKFETMVKSMPPVQLMQFIVTNSFLKPGSAEYIKKVMLVESQYIRNKAAIDKERKKLSLKVKNDIEQLQIYRKYDAKEEVNEKIIQSKKSIVENQLKLNSVNSLTVFLDVAKDMCKKYLVKPSTNLKAEVTETNIGIIMGYFGHHKFDDAKNANGLKEFAKEHKIPMSPLYSNYQAVLAEKELIKLGQPSKFFEGEHGEKFKQFYNDFYKTGKISSGPAWDKKVMLEVIQRKTKNIKQAMYRISLDMQEHEEFFKKVSKPPPENKTIFHIKPATKQDEIRARLIGYGSMLNLMRKLDAKYLRNCQDFKMTAMLNEPKGVTFKQVLKKQEKYSRTYTTGKGLGATEHIHGARRLDEDLGSTANSSGKRADIYGEKMKVLNHFLGTSYELPKYEALAGSEMIQPFVKAELSKTFDTIESKLFSENGHVGEAARKINGMAYNMKNPGEPFTLGYGKAIKLCGEASSHCEKANDILLAEWQKLGKTGLAANEKYKNNPQLRDQIKKSIKQAQEKIWVMMNDKKALYGSEFETKLALQKLDLQNALDKKVMITFATSIANVAILAAAVGTAMIGGSAFAALGQRLFARVASAGLQNFLVTTTSMAGASAGGVVGSRGMMSVFQATGMIDYGGFKKIWEAKGLAKDFVMGFAMSMSAVYAARGAMAGLEMAARSPGKLIAHLGKAGLKTMKSLGKLLDPENYIYGKATRSRQFLREFSQEGMEEGVERTNPYVGWLVAAIGCSKRPNAEIALHGLGATEIGLTSEGNNFVYTTSTAKEFVNKLASKFGNQADQHFSYKIDIDGTVFVYLKSKVRGKDKTISAFEVKPAQNSDNLTPQSEITRIKNLTQNKKGEYKFKNKEDYQETILELRERGFLAIQNADGTVSIRKGGLEISIKLPKGTEIMSEEQITDRKRAESFLIKNKVRIVKYFKNKTIREAFVLLVKDCHGSLKEFNQKYGLTKYAKKIPKSLLNIRIIPIPRLEAMGCGPIPEFVSVNDLRSSNNPHRKPGDQTALLKIDEPKTTLDKVIQHLHDNMDYRAPNASDLLLKLKPNEIKELLQIDWIKSQLFQHIYTEELDSTKVKKICDKFKGHIDLETPYLENEANNLKSLARHGRMNEFWTKLANVQNGFHNFKNPLDIQMSKKDVPAIIQVALFDVRSSKSMEIVYKKLLDTGITQQEIAKIANENVNSILKGIERSGIYNDNQINSFLWFFEAAGLSKDSLFIKLKETASNLFNKKNNFYFALTLEETCGIRIKELGNTDSLSKNPYGYEYRGLKKTEYMAYMYRAINKIPHKYRRQWSVDKLFKEMERMHPDQVGTEKQKKLVIKMLNKMKEVQGMIDAFKEGGQLENVARGFLDTQSAFLYNNKDFPIKVKVVEDHMFIYVPRKILAAMLNGIQDKAAYESFISRGEHKKSFGDAYHFVNYIEKSMGVRFGMVSIMDLQHLKKGNRGEGASIGKHEARHGETAFLDIGHNYNAKIKPEFQKALKDKNYKKFIDKKFQWLLQLRVRDEIYSYITDGRIQSKGVKGFYDWFKNTYLKENLPELDWDSLPADQRDSLKQHYDKMLTKYEYLAFKAIKNASEIIKYPNGFALLRLTDVSHWPHLLKDLKNKQQPKAKNETKTAPDTKTKQAEILRKAGFTKEADSILNKDTKFLGSTGHPVRTLAEVKTAVRELSEFKIVEDLLTNHGLTNEIAKIKAGQFLDSNTTNPTTFSQKLEHAHALLATHKRIIELNSDILSLDPSLKNDCLAFADYSAKGRKKYPSFASRISSAEALLTQARQFKKSGIEMRHQYEMSDYLQSSNAQDALTDIIIKYGNDTEKVRSSKEWKALTWRIEKKYPGIESNALHKVLNNEMQRLKKVYEQSFLNASPIETKTTLDQRVVMAEFFKDFADLKLDTKHKLKPIELMNKVFEKNPDLKKRLTSKQLKLIENKLEELGKHYSEINRIKSMSPEQQRGYVEGMIKKEYPNFDFSAGVEFKIYFGGHTGSTIYVYFPRSTFIQMQYSESHPEKKWSSLTKKEQQARVDDPKAYGIASFGALNMMGNVVFINNQGRPLTERNKTTELHEDVHTMTFLSGAKESPKWTSEHYDKLLREGKYEEYIKLRFQEEFTGISDEIVAKIIDGTPQERIIESFKNTYWHHYTKNILPRIPVEHRYQVASLHSKALREFGTIFKRAHYFANKIKTYPNGENVLRFTPVQKWELMYKHLKTKYGYEILTNNVEQTLPVAKEQAFKCANGEIYISDVGIERKIVKDEYGYALERNGQLVDLVDGGIYEFKGRGGKPATLEIRVEGDRIHITNLSDKPNRIDVYETTPEVVPQAASVKGVLSEALKLQTKQEIEKSETKIKKAQELLNKEYNNNTEILIEAIGKLNHHEVGALLKSPENIRKIKHMIIEDILPNHAIADYITLKTKLGKYININTLTRRYFEKLFKGDDVDIMDITFAKKIFPDIETPAKFKISKADLESKISKMVDDWQDPKIFIRQYRDVALKSGFSEAEFKNLCFGIISQRITHAAAGRGRRRRGLNEQQWRYIKNIFNEIGVTSAEVKSLSQKLRDTGNETRADSVEKNLLPSAEETLFTTNPFERKMPSIEKIELMALVARAFDKIPERYKESWTVENLYQQILRREPGLEAKLSPGQKKLIKKKLRQFKERYRYINNIKESPAAQKKLIQEIFAARGLTIPKDIKYKIVFKNGTINIYFSKASFTRLIGKIEDWDSLKAAQKKLHIKEQSGSLGANIPGLHGGIVNALNGLKRTKATETHEGEHAFAQTLGVRQGTIDLDQKSQRLLKEGKYKQAIEAEYQASSNAIMDEILAFTKEGKLQSMGSQEFYKGQLLQYIMTHSTRIERMISKLPGGARAELMPRKAKYDENFTKASKQAIENALRIVRYPNGLNILRLTHISRWEKVLARLEDKYGVM